MSGNLLSMDPNYRHRFADELESMLYVTLYCCVRWIPHNCPRMFSYHAKKFFLSSEDYQGVEKGDKEKVWEAQFRRTFTSRFEFSFRPVRDWISDMYELLGPVYSGEESNWNEDSLRRLWRAMVKLDLPDGDRVDHNTYGLLDGRLRSQSIPGQVDGFVSKASDR